MFKTLMQAISLEATRQLFHVDFWVDAMNEHIKHQRQVHRLFEESLGAIFGEV